MNFLLSSLSADTYFIVINEYEAEYFDNWFLRPLADFKEKIDSNPNPYIFKPISETKIRSIQDVIDEYSEYDVQVVWIYRNPVNVYYSQVIKLGNSVHAFISDWNKRNTEVLNAYAIIPERITVVKYKDLIGNEELFNKLCNKLNIKGVLNFEKDSESGMKILSKRLQKDIVIGTKEVYSLLDQIKLKL